jgi:transposase
MANFISHGRSQALVLSHDLREWAPEDDPCHFIIEAVERIPIGAFKVNWKSTGKARHPPRMMLALLIYCSANGIFSSRRIGKVIFRDVAVWFVAADPHPEHDTVATFRREHQTAFAATIAAPCNQVGRPTTVLGDAGFANGEAIKSIEARKTEVLAAISRPDNPRTCDFRPLKPDARPPPEPGAGWRKRMRETMRTEAVREKYKRRKCTVEPVFGILRNVLGFNRFHLGGIESVKAEGLLVALADNCKRLCNLNAAKAAAA